MGIESVCISWYTLVHGDPGWATALWCWVEFSRRLQSEEMGSKPLSSLPDFLVLWVRFLRSLVLKECLYHLSLLPHLLFVLHSIPSVFHSLLKFVPLRWLLGCQNWGSFNTDDLFLDFPEPSRKPSLLCPLLLFLLNLWGLLPTTSVLSGRICS